MPKISNPIVEAATIFSDTFSGGYNDSLWTIYPGQFPPISTAFGIAVDPLHASDYSSLVHDGILPKDTIIKVDMKINTLPASDIGIFIENSTSNSWKNAYMFGVGYGGTPNKILLRDSNNTSGITGLWNPSVGIHHIELSISGAANSTITLKEDGATLLTWNSSNLDFTVNKIILSMFGVNSEFANFQLCDIEGCVNATPTPTPTPTPSPTPTPPPPTTKTIIIPGLGASWNADALLNCKPDSYTGDWTLNPVATTIYEPIQTALTAAGVTPILLPYDWRRSVTDNRDTLASFIAANTTGAERVHVVGHSMGGLVGRAYYEAHKGETKLDHFLTAGSPHKGTPYAYPAWSGGEIWNSDILFRIYLTLLTKRCNRSHGTSNRESVQQFIPSIQELLPTADYLRNGKTKTIIPVATMQAKNSWLPNAFFNPPFVPTVVGSLLGAGLKTLRGMDVRPPTRREIARGDWLDGNPYERDQTGDGDGTVLAESAPIDGAEATIIPQSHIGLIQSPDGVNAILSFLGVTPTTAHLSVPQSQPTEPSSAMLIIGDQATLQLDVPGAASVQDVQGIITVVNPKKGRYTLRVNPLAAQNTVTVAQFLQDGRVVWREYPQTKNSPRVKTLQFDPQNAQEDILK